MKYKHDAPLTGLWKKYSNRITYEFKGIPSKESMKGHRWGTMVAEAIVWSKDKRRVHGVLFRCDCKKAVLVTIVRIKHSKIPHGCKKCQYNMRVKNRGRLKSIRDKAKRKKLFEDLRNQNPRVWYLWKDSKHAKKLGHWWQDWIHFAHDMAPKPHKWLVLCHTQPVKVPWCRDNCYWGFNGQDKANKVVRFGKYYVTFCWMSYALGIPIAFCRTHYKIVSKGMTRVPELWELAEKWFSGKYTVKEGSTILFNAEWYDIAGTNKRYQVSNTGLVKSGYRIIDPEPDGNGNRVYKILVEPTGPRSCTVNELMVENIPAHKLKGAEVIPTPPQIFPNAVDVIAEDQKQLADGKMGTTTVETGITIVAGSGVSQSLAGLPVENERNQSEVAESMSFLFPEAPGIPAVEKKPEVEKTVVDNTPIVQDVPENLDEEVDAAYPKPTLDMGSTDSHTAELLIGPGATTEDWKEKTGQNVSETSDTPPNAPESTTIASEPKDDESIVQTETNDSDALQTLQDAFPADTLNVNTSEADLLKLLGEEETSA